MATVINTPVAVLCQHKAPLVIVGPSQTKLRVDGRPALVESDLTAGTFPACPNTPKCVQVMTIDQGLATALRVDGDPVVLSNAQGTTKSGATWSVGPTGPTSMEAT